MLAIIIPFYKLTFFEATLQSLASQSDKRFKVYIGDDASPEDCTALLQKFEGQFDFTYHRFESNLGGRSLTQQWERCIALSGDEEWLMILGDDDVLGENVVEEFNLFIKEVKTSVDLVRFNLKVIDKYGQIQDEFINQAAFETDEDLLESIFQMKSTITATEFVFSRKIYLANNCFVNYPLAWFSDYATWLKFSRKSGIYNLRKAEVYWRLSGENISSISVNPQIVAKKVESLFLFISFLQNNFSIPNNKIKYFTQVHMSNLLSHLTFFQVVFILGKHFFRGFLVLTIIFEFVSKKIKRKIIKIYGGIHSTSKR